MGFVILLIVALFEIIFAILRIIQKRSYTKTRSILRICFAVIFAAGLLFKWIQRTPTTAPFAAILALFTLISILRLIQKADDQQPIRAGKAIAIALGTLLLFGLAIFPMILLPLNPLVPQTGDLPFKTAVYAYTDESRTETYTDKGEKRSLNVECWYPDAAGTEKYPLLVFSHGMNGVRSSNDSLFIELASHGYVTCSIDHLYQAMFSESPSGKMTFISRKFLKQMNDLFYTASGLPDYDIMQELMKIRVGDMNFVIDTLLANSNSATDDPVYSKIDPDKISVMGHSMGGATALEVGRQRADVRAVLSLEAPFFGDITGVDGKNFSWITDPYPVPLLHIYSDSTWGKMGTDPTYLRNQQYLDAPQKDMFNVHLSGSQHLSLTDLALVAPLIAQSSGKWTTDPYITLKQIDQLGLGFFNRYLKNEGEFNPQPEY